MGHLIHTTFRILLSRKGGSILDVASVCLTSRPTSLSGNLPQTGGAPPPWGVLQPRLPRYTYRVG